MPYSLAVMKVTVCSAQEAHEGDCDNLHIDRKG